MRILRPSLAVAALPLAFAAGALLARARVPLRGSVIEHVTNRRIATGPDVGKLVDGYGSGQDDDLDGDGELDCWAMWWQEGSCCTGGVLEVRPRCGDASWRMDTSASRYDHLQIGIVPRPAPMAAVPRLAKALWGDLAVGAADSLTDWLLASQKVAPDPWTPGKGELGDAVDGVAIPPTRGAGAGAQVAQLTPDQARAARIDPGDGIAVLVAHEDGGDAPVPVCGGVTQSGEHLAWNGRWILASEGEYTIGDVQCLGDIVLVRESDGPDGNRVIAIDTHAMRRATLAGAQYVTTDDDVADLWADDEHDLRLTARELAVRIAGADDGFNTIVNAVAVRLHARIAARGTRERHRFAVLRAEHGFTGAYLIEAAPGQDYLITFEDDGHTDAWDGRGSAIVHHAGHSGGTEVTRIALVDGVPTVLAYTYTDGAKVTRLGRGSFARIDGGDAGFQVRGPSHDPDVLVP